MNRNRLEITTMMLTLLMFLPVLPALAQATITVTTDKNAYGVNDALVVKGTVSPVTTGQDVTIILYSPTNERKAFDQVTPAANGTYSKTIKVFGTDDVSGVWSVTATYQGVQASSTILFAGVPQPTPKTSIVITVNVDVASILAKGETANFYVLTSSSGAPIAANISYAMYGPTALTGTVTNLGTGINRISAPIPANATVGTYAIVANATYSTDIYQGSGVGEATFVVSTISDNIASLTTTSVPAVAKSAADASAAATAAKASVDSMSTVLYVAVILALIAAVAAIASVVQITRKIAG